MKPYQKAAYEYQTEVSDNKDQLLASQPRRQSIYASRLRKFLPKDNGATLLDCACGNGTLSLALNHLGYKNVDSIDMDPCQVALAQSIGVGAVQADALAWLADREDRYQGIFALDFLEHLDKDRALTFLTLAYAALRPSGSLILRTPCAEAPFFGVAAFNDLTHEWVATSGVLRNMLRMTGFDTVIVLDDGPAPYGLKNILRLAALRLTCGIVGYWSTLIGIGRPAIWTPNMWAVAVRCA